MREEGEDFRSDMPGAELEGLYEIRAAGELLKLLARAFRLADPDAEPETAPADPDGEATGPVPTRLPFRRIPLD